MRQRVEAVAAVPTEVGIQAPARSGVRILIGLVVLAVLGQALYVVDARPQELVSGIFGMIDMLARATPPAFDQFDTVIWPALETIDIALVGTAVGIALALPLAVLAATNVTPAKPVYYVARSLIAIARAVPDLVWALLFVTAVGLGPFPGALAQSVHSVGMLGRLFAEVIEDIDMGPVEALRLTGASRLQVFTHGVVPGVLPSLLGIGLYRLDENFRSSLVLGFVGAGGLGFQILTAMNLFQYRTISLLLIVTFAMVVAMERGSAFLRRRVG